MFPRVAAHTLGHINRNIFRSNCKTNKPKGYRSRSKNGGYFGKRAADARQTSPRNTEVGARMAATSVNREQLQDKQAQGIPK